MSTNWDGEFKKLYEEVSDSWLMLPLAVRGIGCEVLRVSNRVSGKVGDTRDTRALIRKLGGEPSDAPLVEAAVTALLEQGFLMQDERGALFVTNLAESQREQRAKWAEKKRNQRAAASTAVPSSPPTVPDCPPVSPVVPETVPLSPREGEGEEREKRSTPLPPKGTERALPEPDPEDHQAVAKRYMRDPMARELLGPPEAWAPVVAVLDAVSSTFGIPKPSALPGLKDPRVKAIIERLNEGIPLVSLLDAIRGAKLDEHLMRNPQFQTAATILRDSAQVDRFRALLAAPPKPKTDGASDSAAFDWRAEKAASKAAEAARKANEAEAHKRTMERIKAQKAVAS